ncbi:MAG: antitoxin family protein [Oscillochloridaceae bacterium umkhey_bin13]
MAIRAWYRGGVLRLQEPLDMPEGSEVEIVVVRREDDVPAAPPPVPSARDQLEALLVAAGVTLPRRPRDAGRVPLSEAERLALAKSLPPNLNLTQAISEDREDRV